MANDNQLPINRFPLSNQAACVTVTDPEIFFPTGSGRKSYREARRICASCPVQLECLEWELQFETPSTARSGLGMFGGKHGVERSKILRQRKGTT